MGGKRTSLTPGTSRWPRTDTDPSSKLRTPRINPAPNSSPPATHVASSMFCERIHVPTSVGIVVPIMGPFILLFGVFVNTVVVHVSHQSDHHMFISNCCHHVWGLWWQ